MALRAQTSPLEFRVSRRVQTVFVTDQRSQQYTIDETWPVARVVNFVAQQLGTAGGLSGVVHGATSLTRSRV